MAAGQPGDVEEITVLKSQPNSEKALELLRKIHSKVKPIMKKHGWTLPTLAEFFPKNPGLLGININRGRKICIRLRPAHDPYSFLPLEEELIGTMLHELTHNHRGPHDDIFFKFLDGLFEEYDALVMKGYTGEGFLGSGHRVGEGVSHDSGLSMREAREKALKTFEEKEKVRKVLGKGGVLGGRKADTKGKRMGEILADAAERRLRAKKMCGGDDAHSHPSGSAQEDLPREVQDEIEKADRDSRRVVIDLTQDDELEDDADDVGEVGRKGKEKGKNREVEKEDRKPSLRARSSSPDLIIISETPASTSTISSATKRSSTSTSKLTQSAPATKRRPIDAPPRSASTSSTSHPPPTKTPRRRSPDQITPGWTCLECTFHNLSPLSLICEICLSERSIPPSSSRLSNSTAARTNLETPTSGYIPPTDGWECHVCSRENAKELWCCSDCGKMKLSS